MAEDNVDRQSDQSSSNQGANPPAEAVPPLGHPPPPHAPQHSQQFPPSPGHPCAPQYGHYQQQPGAAFDDSSAVSETGRDLDWEAHLRAIGFWFMVSPLTVAFYLSLLLAAGGASAADVIFILPGLGPAVLGLMLRRYSDPARIIAGVFTCVGSSVLLFWLLQALSLMGEPSRGKRRLLIFLAIICLAALAWGIYTAVTLFSSRSARICTPAYRQLVSANPQTVRTFQSHFFWVPLVMLAGFFFLVPFVLARLG